MTCHKNHLSSFMAVIALWGFVFFSVANAGERDDLYENGLKAYESKDYAVALKKLYAFYILNEDSVDAHPVFKEALLERISISESILRVSYAASPSVLLDDGRIRIYTRQGPSFRGSGREIESLLNSREIDLESIQNINRDSLTMPSSGR